jgi:hypothetical protein
MSRLVPIAAFGVLAVAASCGAGEQAEPVDGWATVTDGPSGARIDLPEAAEPTADTAAAANGPAVTLRNYTASAAGGALEVGFNVLDTRGGRYDFGAGVAQVATSLDGRIVSSLPTAVDGHAAVDVEVSYGRGQVVLFQLIDADDHVLQPLVAGPADRRDLVEKTFDQLTGSLDVEAS